MRNTGKDIIDSIVKRLEEEDIICTDSNILHKLRSLDFFQLNQLTVFGDVQEWHNDRIDKQGFDPCERCDGEGMDCVKCKRTKEKL